MNKIKTANDAKHTSEQDKFLDFLHFSLSKLIQYSSIFCLMEGLDCSLQCKCAPPCLCAQGAECGCISAQLLSGFSALAFSVEGMTCHSCVETLESALSKAERSVRVSLDPPFCVVWEKNKDEKSAAASVQDDGSDVGFTLTPISANFLEIQGITCSACTDTLEHALKSTVGVVAVRVELDGKAVVLGNANANVLIEACSDVGYTAAAIPAEQASWGTALILDMFKKRADGAPSTFDAGPASLKKVEQSASDEELLFSVDGMRCAACVNKIERAVLRVPGVSSAAINLMSKALRVTVRKSAFSGQAQVLDAVRSAGYDGKRLEVGSSTLVLRVEAAQVDDETLIQAALQMPGVVSARRDAETNELVVVYVSASQMKVRDMVYMFRDRSVVCHPVSPFERMTEMLNGKNEIREYGMAFLWCLLFFVPTMLFGMVFMWIDSVNMVLMRPVFASSKLSISTLILFLLATPVQFWLGHRFHAAAFRALRHKALTMDTLVSLGTFCAYGYSLIAFLIMCFSSTFESEVFFEASVSLITFITMGRFLEA